VTNRRTPRNGLTHYSITSRGRRGFRNQADGAAHIASPNSKLAEPASHRSQVRVSFQALFADCSPLPLRSERTKSRGSHADSHTPDEPRTQQFISSTASQTQPTCAPPVFRGFVPLPPSHQSTEKSACRGWKAREGRSFLRALTSLHRAAPDASHPPSQSPEKTIPASVGATTRTR